MNYLEMKKKALHLIVGKVKGFVRSVTGTPPISLEVCADNASIIDYKIHGNSFQDGEPSPDNPIEVQSVGELVTDESDVNYGKYKIPVTARSKNLFNVDYYIYYNTEQETIRGDTKFSDNFWKNEDGNGLTFKTLAYASQYNNYPLTLKENTQYTLSFEAEWLSTDSRAQFAIRIGYDDNTYKSVAVRFSDIKQKYTLTSETNKTLCSIQVSSWQYNGTCKMFNIQLEEGEAATDYEPYHEPTTTNIYLDEPLRKVGDYADYIDFKNSVVVRNIGTYVITGNENIIGNFVDGSGTRSYILLANKKIGDSNSEVNILSDKLLGVGFKTASSTINNVHTYSGDTRIGFKIAHSLTNITTDDTVEAVKSKLSTWFKNNKVVTYYHLQNSTQTSIPLPILPTFKGITTVYEVGTTIQPSNMEAEYYSTLKGE